MSQLRDDFLDVADDEQPLSTTTALETQRESASGTTAAVARSSSSSDVHDASGSMGVGGGYRSATDGPLEGAGVVRRGPGQWLMVASHLKGWLPSPMELLQLNQHRYTEGFRLRAVFIFTLVFIFPSLSPFKPLLLFSVFTIFSSHPVLAHDPSCQFRHFRWAFFSARAANGQSHFALQPVRVRASALRCERQALLRVHWRPLGRHAKVAIDGITYSAAHIPFVNSHILNLVGTSYCLLPSLLNYSLSHVRTSSTHIRSGLAGLASASYVMLPLVVTPPPSSSSSNSDVISPSDEAPLVLPWRDTWDLDDPFPANSSDAMYSRWTEGPAPQVLGGKSTKSSYSNGNSGGSNGGKWSANSGPRAKALDVLAMVDNAAAAGTTSSSQAGSALDAFSPFSSFSSSTSSGTSSSSAPPPPPPPSQKARGKWARAAGYGKGASGGGSRRGGGSGGFGSSNRRGSSNAWTYHAQEEANGGARARTARGLLDDDLGVSGAAASHGRLGPSEELGGHPHQPGTSAAASFPGPGGGKEEPTFVVPASLVSQYVKS